MIVSKKPIVLEMKPRETLSQDLEVQLSAFGASGKLTLNDFSLVLEGRQGTANKSVESQLRAILEDGRNPVALVRLTLRPKIGEHFDLIVRHNSTLTQWRQAIRILVPPPPIDDTIFIEASLQKPSSVTFALRNRLDRDVHFQAYFTKESTSEYSVSPKSGVLKPGSPEENGLTITYQPTTFGRSAPAILMVEVGIP
jgi:hypothetical protein